MDNYDDKPKQNSEIVDTSTDKPESRQRISWAVLACLIVIFIVIILNQIGAFQNLATTMGSGGQKRDFSTPSSRLMGHWKNVALQIKIWGVIYYGPIEPALRIGIYRLCNTPYGSYGPPFQFKILFEEHSGQKLIIRVFKNLGLKQLEATTGLDFSKSDIVCCISKDGQLMSQEYTCMGERVLVVYRYVDNKTTP